MKTELVSISRLTFLWTSGVYADEICKELCISSAALYRLTRRHGLGSRGRLPARHSGKPQRCADRIDVAGNGFEPRVDPTPAEIEERAKWIRDNWWTNERREGRSKPLELPCFAWSPVSRKYTSIPSSV